MHEPKFWVIATVVLTLLGSLAFWFGLPVAPWILWGVAIFCCFGLGKEMVNETWRTLTGYVEALAKIPMEGWRHLKVPMINYVETKDIGNMWENTVPYEAFILFMEGSSFGQTYPLNRWLKNQLPGAQWRAIYLKLVELRFVIGDSAAGNHSQRWKPGGWEEAWNRWMPGKIVPRLEAPRATLAQVYNADTSSPTEKKDRK